MRGIYLIRLGTKCQIVKNVAEKFSSHLDAVIVGKHFVLNMYAQRIINAQNYINWASTKYRSPENLCLPSLRSAYS